MKKNLLLISYIKQNFLLEKIINIYSQKGLKPIWGYEIEFYLNSNASYKDIEKELKLSVQIEKGKNQYEINQGPFDKIQDFIQSILNMRKMLIKFGAILDPKPFKNDYGSSMHLHFNFLNQKSENIFDQESWLDFAANGVCSFINQTIALILTSQNDYRRLEAKFMAPTKTCYGNNNRSVAVRIPASKPLRLEYRLCSNFSDPYIAAFVILKSALLGMINRCNRYPKIFGNAHDDQYALEEIAKSFKEANEALSKDFFLQDIMYVKV